MSQPTPPPRWQQPTPPPSYPPAYPAQPPQPQGRRILGMTLGVFLGIVGAAVFLCCLVPAGFLVFGGVLSGINEATTEDPTAAIISCEVTESEVLPSADVQWEITNHDDQEGNWTVTITVHDGQGRQVGETFDGAFGIAPGATVVSEVTVFLDAAGGETCEIAVD